MTENKVIEIIVDHLQAQFPRSCPTCGQDFANLQDYLSNTEHVGKPISYDAEEGNWQPKQPQGTLSLANCLSCGTTISLGSKGMSLLTMWRLMLWAKRTTKKRGITVSVLLEDLRKVIDARVLKEASNSQSQVEATGSSPTKTSVR